MSFLAALVFWANTGFSLIGLAAAAGGWLVFSGLLAWHAQAWPEIAYRHASYKVDGQGIEIRRGVFWRTIINIPRSRVQHTDVSQGPLERTHELGTLVVYTAGTDHARVDLPGLAHARALRIRDTPPAEGGKRCRLRNGSTRSPSCSRSGGASRRLRCPASSAW